jgi:hypothetical protein
MQEPVQTKKECSVLPSAQMDTDEAYETMKGEVIRANRITALLWIGYCSSVSVAIVALPFYIPQGRLPSMLRAIWNPYSLIFVLMVPFILLLRFSPFGRRAVANIPLANAVLTFERAQKEHTKWQQTKDPSHLRKSYNYILGAQEWLECVPKFSEWKCKIVEDYERNGR